MPMVEAGFLPRWTRPIRIPESVPLRHADPPFGLAGERGTWRLPLELARDVAPETLLKLQTGGGRNARPGFADDQAADPRGEGYVSLQGPDGAPVPLTPDEARSYYTLARPERALRAGEVLTLVVGDRSGGGPGARMPTMRALNKFVVLYEAQDENDRPNQWNPANGGRIVAACSMHVLGGPIHHVRAYVPSHARPGQEIVVLVRPEDEHSNLSPERLDGGRVSLNGRALDARAEAVPESSCLRLHVVLPHEGVHRLRVAAGPGGWTAEANPIVCADSRPALRPHWGILHAHTEMSDGRESLDAYFHQLRREAGLDFGATGDHDSRSEHPDGFWQATCRAVRRWHDPGAFVTFLGYEWARWRRNGDGDRNVYFLHDDRPMYRADDADYPSPPDLFAALQDEAALVMPHHTARSGNPCDWKDHDPVHERLVEIYQILGCYECSEEDGNPLPQRSDPAPFRQGYVRNALAAGWRVGFTGGGDDHEGHAGTEFPHKLGDEWRMVGLTCVLAAACTREAIWDGLWQRRVIATTGPRILLDYTLSGRPLGSELSLAEDGALDGRRTLDVRCHATAPLEWIQIVRNNTVVHTHAVEAPDCELTWVDDAPLGGLWMPAARYCPHPFCFYYVRARQRDGQMAWASPVWIGP
ncbi:MAG: DUF3604 domain-containing protein [Candidatus Brocadiaceae bacterium]|nr:DUF3604 domain-containing protein [Candidatus Brocadiaceae bacterium]